MPNTNSSHVLLPLNSNPQPDAFSCYNDCHVQFSLYFGGTFIGAHQYRTKIPTNTLKIAISISEHDSDEEGELYNVEIIKDEGDWVQ